MILRILEGSFGPQKSQIAFGAEIFQFLQKRASSSCETMLSDYQGVYKQVITGDESWIYAYDPETTDQSSEYRLKGETKPKRSLQWTQNDFLAVVS